MGFISLPAITAINSCILWMFILLGNLFGSKASPHAGPVGNSSRASFLPGGCGKKWNQRRPSVCSYFSASRTWKQNHPVPLHANCRYVPSGRPLNTLFFTKTRNYNKDKRLNLALYRQSVHTLFPFSSPHAHGHVQVVQQAVEGIGCLCISPNNLQPLFFLPLYISRAALRRSQPVWSHCYQCPSLSIPLTWRFFSLNLHLIFLSRMVLGVSSASMVSQGSCHYFSHVFSHRCVVRMHVFQHKARSLPVCCLHSTSRKEL